MRKPINLAIWVGLVFWELSFVRLAYQNPVARSGPEAEGKMFWSLLVVALMISVGSFFYRKMALVEPIRSGVIDLGTKSGIGRASKVLYMNFTLSLAVGLYGFVLSYMYGKPQYAVGFVTLGLSLLVLHRPWARSVNKERDSLS